MKSLDKRFYPVLVATSWRFWALGWFWVRQTGKLPKLTIGLGPLRIALISKDYDPETLERSTWGRFNDSESVSREAEGGDKE